MQQLERSALPGIRAAMRHLQFVVAEVDSSLRYVWVENPHPDFSEAAVIGKRDDELLPAAEAADIMALKQAVLDTGQPVQRVLGFQRSDAWHFYCISAIPLRDGAGAADGMITIAFDTPGVLRGLMPICSYCRKIRDDDGTWQAVEAYLHRRTEARFSHGICPDCYRETMGESADQPGA